VARSGREAAPGLLGAKFFFVQLPKRAPSNRRRIEMNTSRFGRFLLVEDNPMDVDLTFAGNSRSTVSLTTPS